MAEVDVDRLREKYGFPTWQESRYRQLLAAYLRARYGLMWGYYMPYGKENKSMAERDFEAARARAT